MIMTTYDIFQSFLERIGVSFVVIPPVYTVDPFPVSRSQPYVEVYETFICGIRDGCDVERALNVVNKHHAKTA